MKITPAFSTTCPAPHNRYNRNYDWLKLILAFMVVAIHTRLLPELAYAIFKVAVPEFFIISSYLFFTKIRHSKKQEQLIVVWRYIYRIIKLYLFWSILLLPITIIYNNWYTLRIPDALWQICKSFLTGETFTGAWYLLASVYGTVIIFALGKIIRSDLLLVFSLIPFLLCCAYSSYSGLIPDSISKTSDYLNYIFFGMYPSMSITYSLFWISVGKYFSEKIEDFRIRPKWYIAILLAGIVLLYTEHITTTKLEITSGYGCYLSIALIAIPLFLLVSLPKDTSERDTTDIRRCSTIIFCSHGAIKIIANKILGYMSINNSAVSFVVVSLCSIIFAYLIIAVCRRFHIRLLKLAF